MALKRDGGSSGAINAASLSISQVQATVAAYRSSMAAGEHNPSYEGSWVDASGNIWRRKGKRGHVLEDRRVRTLLRRDDVPLVVWRSFEATKHDDVGAKLAAADGLRATADDSEDVVASEWKTEDGSVLLMLEHHC